MDERVPPSRRGRPGGPSVGRSVARLVGPLAGRWGARPNGWAVAPSGGRSRGSSGRRRLPLSPRPSWARAPKGASALANALLGATGGASHCVHAGEASAPRAPAGRGRPVHGPQVGRAASPGPKTPEAEPSRPPEVATTSAPRRTRPPPQARAREPRRRTGRCHCAARRTAGQRWVGGMLREVPQDTMPRGGEYNANRALFKSGCCARPSDG